jgi:hypothetical protein
MEMSMKLSTMQTHYSRPKSTASAICFALAASAFAIQASAATAIYTDRSLWEAALTGTINTEDFNGVTPVAIATDTVTSIGSLSIETTNTTGFTQINDGSGGQTVNGSNYLQLLIDGSPIRSANLIFPEKIFAWGMDFNHSADQTHVTFADVIEMPIAPHNTSGFVGFISDTSFDQVALTDPYISFSAIGMDNISYVSAIPVPAAVWLFGSGLIGLIGIARRKKA